MLFLFFTLTKVIYVHNLSQIVYNACPQSCAFPNPTPQSQPLASHLHVYFFIYFKIIFLWCSFLFSPFKYYLLSSFYGKSHAGGFGTFLWWLGTPGSRLSHEFNKVSQRQVSSVPGRGSPRVTEHQMGSPFQLARAQFCWRMEGRRHRAEIW